MAQILAIELDATEARLALATTRRGGFTVQRALSVQLPSGEGDQEAPAEAVGQAIKEVIARERLSAGTVLVGIGRSASEMRELDLPPAPDEDLPELVQHLAARQFSVEAETARLDFVPVEGNPNEPRKVLAAAIAEHQAQVLERIWQAAGVKPSRWLLRPLAAGSLFLRRYPDTNQVVLLVDVLDRELDLTVIAEGQVRVTRTIRIPSTEQPEKAILGEIRRTIISVQNQADAHPVESIHVCCGSDDHQQLQRLIQDELSIETRRFLPFDGVRKNGPLPEHPGRYASLLGMLTDEALDASHVLDFLDPRQPPVPLNKRRLAIAVGAVLAVLIGSVGYGAYSDLAELDKQVASIKKEIADQEELLKLAKARESEAAEIQKWADREIIWLEELRDLSVRFPSQRDAVLLRLSMAAGSEGRGSMDMTGLVRDPSIVSTMETNIREENHDVHTKRVDGSTRGPVSIWEFQSSITLEQAEKDWYLHRLSSPKEELTPQKPEETADEKTPIDPATLDTTEVDMLRR
jgi:Tfp pilus assembly PilM family ATPase